MMHEFHFRPELLEPPEKFYARELEGCLSRPNHAGWSSTPVCPFHRSQSRGKKKSTAFAVRLDSGAFNCLSCGVHGGDIVSFTMQRDHLSFRQAAQKLGAWDEAPSPETVRRIGVADREREHQRLLKQQQREQKHAELMEARTQLHLTIRFQVECGTRLAELHAGAEPVCADEGDVLWHCMALSLDRERMLECEYYSIAGLGERYVD